MEGAQGSKLFSVAPANTADLLAFTARMQTEITRLFVVNVTGAAVTFRLYHRLESKTSHDISDALWYDKTVAANDALLFSGDTSNGGIHLETGDAILFRTSIANALNLAAFGLTANIAPEVM